MKNWLLFLLLLNHINTTMFFPVIENPVVKDDLGYYDETNSVVEWFQKEVLGQKSRYADDEDDDHPICLLVKSIGYAAYVDAENEMGVIPGSAAAAENIPVLDLSQLHRGFLSRFSPPPDFI